MFDELLCHVVGVIYEDHHQSSSVGLLFSGYCAGAVVQQCRYACELCQVDLGLHSAILLSHFLVNWQSILTVAGFPSQVRWHTAHYAGYLQYRAPALCVVKFQNTITVNHPSYIFSGKSTFHTKTQCAQWKIKHNYRLFLKKKTITCTSAVKLHFDAPTQDSVQTQKTEEKKKIPLIPFYL